MWAVRSRRTPVGSSAPGSLRVARHVCAYGERKTSTVCHFHKLSTFATLGFSYFGVSLFSVTKEPPMIHLSRSRCPRRPKSWVCAGKMVSKALVLRHPWNCRQQVWCHGDQLGIVCSGASVRITHRISRSGKRGPPRLAARRAILGSGGSTTAPGPSVGPNAQIPWVGLSVSCHFLR